MSVNTESSAVTKDVAFPGLPFSAYRESINVDNKVSILDVLVILSDHRLMILSMAALFGITALVISLVLPKRYTARTTLMAPQQSASVSSALATQLGNLNAMASLAGGNLNLKNPNDMYVAMFRTEAVEDAMIRRYNLQTEYRKKYLSDTRKAFEGRFDVDASGKDGLIHISVEDKDPKRAAEMANGYVEEFRRLSQTLAITEASQRRLFFERQMQQTKDQLANAEDALKQSEQAGGMIQLDSQARALIESAASLRAQIAAKEVQLEGMRSYATNENSNVVEGERELESLRSELARLGGNDDRESTDVGLVPPKRAIAQSGLEYLRKMRDVKYYETIFEILARQFEMAKLDEAKEGTLIQVVDPAVTPDKKSFPKRALITVTASVCGCLIGILMAFGKATMERLRQDPGSNAKLNRLRWIKISKSRVSKA